MTRDVEQILQGTFDQAEITSRQIVDLAFTRLLLLTAVWFVLLDGLRPGGQPWTARVWLGTIVGLITSFAAVAGVDPSAPPAPGSQPPARC